MGKQSITINILINFIKNTKGLADKKKLIIIKLLNKFETGAKYNLSQIINFLKNADFTDSEITFTYKVLVKKYTDNIQVDNTRKMPTQSNAQTSVTNPSKKIILLYFNKIIGLLKENSDKTLLRRLLMFEIDQEIHKKWPISNRFFLFLKTLPLMLPLENQNHLKILASEKEFLYPLQNYLIKNIIKPLKDIIIRPGHIKIEKFILITGLNHEAYINFTANLEQKRFLSTTKDEIIFILKNIDYNPELFQEAIEKELDYLPKDEKINIVEKVKKIYTKSISIDHDDHLLYSIFSESKNNGYKLLISDFTLNGNFNWETAPNNINFQQLITESFSLFAMYYQKKSNASHEFSKYCKNFVINVISIFKDPQKKAEDDIKPLMSQITLLSPSQHYLLNQILAFANFLPGKTFNEINHFYENLDDRIKNIFRKQFDTIARTIKNELP